MYRDKCLSFIKKSFKGESTGRRLSEAIKSAQSFYFGEAADLFTFSGADGETFMLSDILPLLPYKKSWFSFDVLRKSEYEIIGPVDTNGECIMINVGRDATYIVFFTKVNIGCSAFDRTNSGKYEWVLYPVYLVVRNTDYSFGLAYFRGYDQFLNDDRWLDGKTVFENFKKDCLPVLSYLKNAVTALSCKNIKPVKVIPDAKINKKRKMTGKEPLYTYHVLDVILPGRRRMTEPGDPTGRTVRLHLCRGHFKEYTAERPLFGKYVGRYWWQPMARGDKKAGVVMKDYNVKVAGR
jgi:hypothetical protein